MDNVSLLYVRNTRYIFMVLFITIYTDQKLSRNSRKTH